MKAASTVASQSGQLLMAARDRPHRILGQFLYVEFAVFVDVHAIELGLHNGHKLLFGDLAVLVGVHQLEQLFGFGFAFEDSLRRGRWNRAACLCGALAGVLAGVLAGRADSKWHGGKGCDRQGDENTSRVFHCDSPLRMSTASSHAAMKECRAALRRCRRVSRNCGGRILAPTTVYQTSRSAIIDLHPVASIASKKRLRSRLPPICLRPPQSAASVLWSIRAH